MIKEQGAWDKGVMQQRRAVIAPTPDQKISDQGVVKAECPHMNPEDQFVPRCSPRRWASAACRDKRKVLQPVEHDKPGQGEPELKRQRTDKPGRQDCHVT